MIRAARAVCLGILVAGACAGLGLAGVVHSKRGQHPDECVVLLHGLGRSSLSMKPMEWYLRANGYDVLNMGYPSRRTSISGLGSEWLPGKLRSFEGPGRRVHFVTHSMGGIVLREFLAASPECRVGRVVMLAPPNRGSEVAERLRRLRCFQKVMGPAAVTLGTGNESVPIRLGPITAETGIIAANRSLNPLFSAWLAGRDDGRVSVASTRLEGMKEHRVVRSTHSGVLYRPAVWKMTARFIADGSFRER